MRGMSTVATCLATKRPGAVSLPPSAKVLAALDLMRDRKMRSVLVVDAGKLKGIVTQGDCAMKVLRPGLSAAETSLEAIMTREPLTVGPEAPLERCMDLMIGQRIRHLPVTEQGHVIGMISIGDLMRHLLNQQSQQIDQLAKHIGTTT